MTHIETIPRHYELRGEERRREIYYFILTMFMNEGRPPSIGEIERKFNTYDYMVYRHLKRLAGRGLIRWQRNTWYGISIPGIDMTELERTA